MKHNKLFVLFFVFMRGASMLWSQQLDSLNAIYYLDSLTQKSNELTYAGNFDQAKTIIESAKAFAVKRFGKQSEAYGNTSYNLGRVLEAKGNFKEAALWYHESLTARNKVHGKESYLYIEDLHALALKEWSWKNYNSAERLFLELSDINKNQIAKEQRYLSQMELIQRLNHLGEIEDECISFMQDHGSSNLAATLYDNCLFYKGFLLQAVNRIQRLVRANPTASSAYMSLKKNLEELSILYSTPCSERDTAMISQKELLNQTLEKELAAKVAGYSEALQQVRWTEVQSHLKSGEVAIEFLRYQYYGNPKTDSVLYAALVLKSGKDLPAFVLLCNEQSLNSLLSKGLNLEQLYTQSTRGAMLQEESQKSLYELIWKPLEVYLTGTHTIYLSASGLFHRLNHSAISYETDSMDMTLADRFHIVTLGSTRQLVFQNSGKFKGKEFAIYGELNYDSATVRLPTNMSQTGVGEEILAFRDVNNSLRSKTWVYLKHSKDEVRSIQKMAERAGFKVYLMKGKEGSEESFKAMGVGKSSPQVIHLATHGFFFPDNLNSRPAFGSSGYNALPLFTTSDHPMMRSGLILSGGNVGWLGVRSKGKKEDGVVTAYEISQMNLGNTELVVLSACETGLGEIQGNEGVYGLQRAFKIAGAKYLIMSLWKVPDLETSEFMKTFYQYWLEKKKTIPEAFNITQQEMKKRLILNAWVS